MQKKLNDLMKKNKLTSHALALKAGVDPGNMSRYVKGQRTPTIEIAKKIAKALNVSLDELTADDKKKSKSA